MKRKIWAGILLAACIMFNASAFADSYDAQVTDKSGITGSNKEQLQEQNPTPKLSKAEQAYQLETMSKLLLGYYHGAWKVCEILNMGTNVENPKKVDRSIVVFNNKIYQLIEQYPLDEPDTQRTTSLATIHGIDKPLETEVSNILGMAEFSQILGAELVQYAGSENQFYIVQMQGEFSDLVLQNVPDRNWVQDQIKGKSKVYPERKYQQLKGTVVGIRMIDYLKSDKSLVWYLHFASEDKKVSGIVVNMNVERATMKISPVSDFSIYIPVWTEEKDRKNK